MVYNITSKPEWRNWQTRCLEGAVPVRACGFDSRLRHEKKRKVLNMYVWGYEEIQVEEGKICKFVVVDVLDLPIELVSSNGLYYALYIKNVEDGELWFLIEEIPPQLLAGYLRGEETIGRLFESGRTEIVKRPYENYNTFVKTDYSLHDFKLPEGSLMLELWDLRVYKSFCSMFDKPFRELLKIDLVQEEIDLVHKLEQAFKEAIKRRKFSLDKLRYEGKINREMLYAA